MTARKTLSLVLVAALAGCGGGTKPSGDDATKQSIPTPKAATVGLGNAIVTTNSAKGGGPKPGALDRLANGESAPGQTGGRDSLIAGAPDTGILDQLPQPEGLSGATKVCAAASAAPSGANLRQVSGAVICLLNAQRTSRGLKPLKANKKLARAALAHAKNMVAKHYFSHNGPDGDPVGRIKKAGYIPRIGIWTVGENLAWGTGASASPGQIMTAWMNSPEHKANILTPGFKEIGIGIVTRAPTTAGPGATFATTFGAIRRH